MTLQEHPQRRHLHTPAAVLTHQIRLFAHRRRAFDSRHGLGRPRAGGRVFAADKDHVPIEAGPFLPVAVPGKPLLLAAGLHEAVDAAVGQEAAA